MKKLNLPIHYSQPAVTPEDLKAVNAVLTSNWLAGGGPTTKKYEKAIAEFTGYRFALAVANATVGLEIAYAWYFADRKSKKLGKTKTGWVFCPTLTFVATANMAYRQGLDIKFSDADDKTFCTYTPDISVSLGGYPLSGRGAVADEAHYLYENMGSYGDHEYKAVVTSHHAVKPLGNAGEGGTIFTNDERFYEFAYEYRNHGRDKNGLTTFAGHNFRMTDIQAALLLSQLDRWYQDNARRHDIARYYLSELEGLVDLPPYHKRHSWHLFQIRLRDTEQRDYVDNFLARFRINTQIHYRPVHQQPLYQYINNTDCPVAEDHFSRSLSIPLHPSLSDEDVEYIVTKIKDAL